MGRPGARAAVGCDDDGSSIGGCEGREEAKEVTVAGEAVEAKGEMAEEDEELPAGAGDGELTAMAAMRRRGCARRSREKRSV